MDNIDKVEESFPVSVNIIGHVAAREIVRVGSTLAMGITSSKIVLAFPQTNKAFPQNNDLMAIVIDGATPDQASDATAALAERLGQRPDLFKSIRIPGGSVGIAYILIFPLVLCALKIAQSEDYVWRYAPLLLASGPVAYVVLRYAFKLKPTAEMSPTA